MPVASPNVSTLNDVAHTIQVALTPVFLLTGIGMLINVFSSRLAHVATQVEQTTDKISRASDGEKIVICHRLDRLRQRSLALDAAVMLGTIGGAATCAAVLTLFYGAVRDAVTASMLYGSFALAISCTIGALCAFASEVMLSSRLLRLRIAHGERDADLREPLGSLSPPNTNPRHFGLHPRSERCQPNVSAPKTGD